MKKKQRVQAHNQAPRVTRHQSDTSIDFKLVRWESNKGHITKGHITPAKGCSLVFNWSISRVQLWIWASSKVLQGPIPSKYRPHSPFIPLNIGAVDNLRGLQGSLFPLNNPFRFGHGRFDQAIFKGGRFGQTYFCIRFPVIKHPNNTTVIKNIFLQL